MANGRRRILAELQLGQFEPGRAAVGANTKYLTGEQNTISVSKRKKLRANNHNQQYSVCLNSRKCHPDLH